MIDTAVARLRDLEPDAVAVLLCGSYARGTAGELSDLDLKAMVEEDGDRYHMWFQERPGMRPLHVRPPSATTARRSTQRSHST